MIKIMSKDVYRVINPRKNQLETGLPGGISTRENSNQLRRSCNKSLRLQSFFQALQSRNCFKTEISPVRTLDRLVG